MAGGMKLVLLGLLALAAVCAAKEVEVDWKIPTAVNTYIGFQKTPLNVGDTLKFKYIQEMHNVVEVGSEDDYKHCTMKEQLSPEYADGHTLMTLHTEGIHYYLCSIPMHCEKGMKLKVQAVEHHHG